MSVKDVGQKQLRVSASSHNMSNVPPPKPGMRWWIAIVAWWCALAWQVWHAWDLSEAYSGCCMLLAAGPEMPFALAGIALSSLGWVRGYRSGRWARCLVAAISLCVAAWVLVGGPVFRYGTLLFAWRHHEQFLREAEAARASLGLGRELPSMPSPDSVFVEGEPPRFGFAQRWIGMLHWTAIVYDPDKTIERDSRERRASMFNYTLLGYDHLFESWYVVWAIK